MCLSAAVGPYSVTKRRNNVVLVALGNRVHLRFANKYVPG